MTPNTIIENTLPIITGLSIGLVIYLGYDRIEQGLAERFKSHVAWVDLKLTQLFFKPHLSESQAMAIAFGPFLVPALLTMLGAFVTGVGLLGVGILALVCGGVGHLSAKLALSILYARRMNRFNEQLLDALSMIANSLKSGLSLLQGFQVIAQNMPPPISQEINTMLSEHTLGATLDEALVNMGNRISSDDLNMVVQAITILRESGGDLSEVFDTMTVTIRDRQKVDGKIKSLTAMGVTQGIMMCAFPWVLGLAFYFTNPTGIGLFFKTPVGWALLGAMVFFEALGALAIKKIVTIDI